MSDHIAAVRAQAEKEAERRWPVPFVGRAAEMEDFANGAVWVASRLTREKIAEAIHRSAYKTLDIEDLTDENYLELFDQADAIMALLVDDTQR